MSCQKDNYKTLNNCKYLAQYHIIWCPKFRFNVLNENIQEELKTILLRIADRYLYEIKEMEIMEDHKLGGL